ncbi:MAG: helix-turn-helix domain-containing protein [Baekduia sp.]
MAESVGVLTVGEQVLPRGRHAAPPEVVAMSQHDRMVVAMAAAVADKGYARVAVADVISGAGVSRRTFYEQFANKEECFLASYDVFVGALLEAITAAADEAGEDASARMLASSSAYLTNLAGHPQFARTFLIEVLGAGAAALDRRELVHQRFAGQIGREYERLRAQRPGLPEAGPRRCRALVGAIHELVIETLLADGPQALPALLPELLEIERRLLAVA